MTIGTIFKATDKLGRTFKYQLEKLDSNNPMREYILNNLTDGSITEVEKEWFNQRIIIIL